MELVHGGDWAGYRARFGHDALDFSANVSPLGLPQGVADAIVAALPTADRYPDPLCRELRTALSRAEQLPEPWILCGKWRSRASMCFPIRRVRARWRRPCPIHRLVWALKPRRALLPAPTFAEYAAALESVGCEVKRKTLHEADDFAVTEAFVQAVNQSIDLVFLCQPNNPTGQITPPELVQRLVRRCADCGAVLVVDECFLDFLQQRDALTAKPLLQTAPNLVILKAFTKLYAMAGVRLGYALCSNTALLAKMQAAGQPWGVSSLAQAAGAAALRETAYADAVRALIADQRPRLAAGLRALGLQVIEGSANYLLFRAPETLGAALQQRGVCLRSCGNYPGLSAGWYRTAVRTAPENEQLLQTMREVLK